MAKKLQLTYKEIEDRLRVFRNEPFQKENIGYHLLWAFGKPEREIERYREGKGVIKTFDGLLIKGLFCYKASTTLQFADELDILKADPQVIKSSPKIIAVSDGQTIRAYDTRERNTFEQQVNRLFCDFEFFYPLVGVERIQITEEAEADIKAAEKLAKLHDEIRAYNEFTSDSDLHDLNTFIARLLFCFFAEDTGIFPSNSFTHAIQQYSHDGITLKDLLEKLFIFMGGKPLLEGLLRTYCKEHFAFVGGGLFEREIFIPQLSLKARQIIIDCGELDWQNINPDIFGSMIQAVVNPDVRANQGMHYTSVPNIMKVINPLFMDELRQEHDNINAQLRKLREEQTSGMLNDAQYWKKCKAIDARCDELLRRMSRMKFFDPACGSGNFLIITYKMLRNLEIEIFNTKKLCTPHGALPFIDSMISLQQFYGIELLDFPHEVAMLSLWLAEHQMNKKMNTYFGVNKRALPLMDINNIRCGNACRMEWNDVCPHTKDEEVFVFGNPPYLGSRRQDASQKEDLEMIFVKDFGELDYIGAWFVKGSRYIRKSKSKFAFVTTNSVCQGLQVALLWKKVLVDDVEIEFAHKSFKWRNNAKYNAGVTVAILGVANKEYIKNKVIYEDSKATIASNISPLLIDMPTIYVESRTRPISSGFPQMNFGNMPADGGKLILSTEEKQQLEANDDIIGEFIRPLIGAEEFINGKQRWCLWLYEEDASQYTKSAEINRRIDELREVRSKSSRPQLAEIPHLFAQITQPMGCSIILIPRVSSENREYIPMGFFEKGNIGADSCMVIGTESIHLFGILTSRIHMDWVRAVGGRLKTDYRYSAGLCYNTFPFPSISESKRTEIEEAATDILLTREPYLTLGKTLADLYDPDTMPADLKAAHERLDGIVESCYPGAPFTSDEARLECLFKLYEKMTKK